MSAYGFTLADTKQKVDSIINSGEGCIIFYGSNKCGLCSIMSQYIAELISQRGYVKVVYVECSKLKIHNPHGGYPVFVFYKNGEPIKVVPGADPAAVKDGYEML